MFLKKINNKNLKSLISFKIFYWVYIFLFGLLFVFRVPIMGKHDEHTHYKKVVTISQGQFFCRNNKPLTIPTKYVHFADSMVIGQKFPQQQYKYNYSNFENNITEDFDGCGLFFLGYTPNVMGFLLGNFISSNNPFLSFYLSRFFTLLFFLFSLYIAFRVIKDRVIKNILVIISMMPMLINQITAISYDGVLICISIILFSWSIYLLEKESMISWKEMCVFILLILLSISLKPVAYFPFIALYFLIPYKKINKSFKRYLINSILFLIFIFVYYLIYLKFGILNGSPPDPNSINYYNVHFQRLLIRRDPFFFIKVFFNSIRLNSFNYYQSMVANYYFGTTLLTRTFYSFIFGGLLIYVILNAKKCSIKINLFSFFSLLVLITGVFSLITLTLYSEFSGLSSDIVSGVQGRYFIPIIFYLFLLIYFLCKKINYKKILYFIYFIILTLVILETSSTLYKNIYQNKDTLTQNVVSVLKNEIENIETNDINFVSILEKNNIIFDTKSPIFGIVLYHNNDNQLYKIPQKWFIKDSSCNKTLRSGYFQIDKLKESNFYEIIFNEINHNDSSLCLYIEPLEYFQNENYLQIGYINNDPLLRPITYLDYYIEINDYGLSYNENQNIGEINKNTDFFQTFTAKKNNLSGVSLLVATYMSEPNVLYDFVLMDDSCSSEIRRVPLDTKSIFDLKYLDIYFDVINDSENKKYCFTLDTDNVSTKKEVNPITIEMSKPSIYEEGSLILNGETKDEDLVFRTLFNIKN